MYGTVARLKVKPGKLDDLLIVWKEQSEKMATVDGAEHAYLYQMDADATSLMMAVVFRDKDSYFANAEKPDTDQWYRRFRECLDADPEWNDGTIIASD